MDLSACAAWRIPDPQLHIGGMTAHRHFSRDMGFPPSSKAPSRNSSVASGVVVICTSVNTASGNCSQTPRSSVAMVSHPNVNMYRPGSVTRPAFCQLILLTTDQFPQGARRPKPAGYPRGRFNPRRRTSPPWMARQPAAGVAWAAEPSAIAARSRAALRRAE